MSDHKQSISKLQGSAHEVSWPQVCISCGTVEQPLHKSAHSFQAYYVYQESTTTQKIKTQHTITAPATLYICESCNQMVDAHRASLGTGSQSNANVFKWLTVIMLIPLFLALLGAFQFLGEWQLYTTGGLGFLFLVFALLWRREIKKGWEISLLQMNPAAVFAKLEAGLGGLVFRFSSDAFQKEFEESNPGVKTKGMNSPI